MPSATSKGFAQNGFAVFPNALDASEIGRLTEELVSTRLRRSRAGVRHAMRDEFVAVAVSPRVPAAPQREVATLEAVTSSVRGNFEPDDLDVPAFIRKRGEM